MNPRMSTGTRSARSSSTSQGPRDGASQAETKRKRVKDWIYEELETVSAVTTNPNRNGTQNNVRSGARNNTRASCVPQKLWLRVFAMIPSSFRYEFRDVIDWRDCGRERTRENAASATFKPYQDCEDKFHTKTLHSSPLHTEKQGKPS